MQIGRTEDIVREVNLHLRDKFDYLICIDGHKGTGKSTLAYEISIKGDEKFSFSRNFVFKKGQAEIEKKFEALEKYAYMTVDEGQRNFYKMEFMSPEQNALIKYFNENRKDNFKCTMFCTPKFHKLSSTLMDYVDMRIHIIARGVAVIFAPFENAIQEDAWRWKECQKIWQEKTKGLRRSQLTTELQIAIYKEMPTFSGVIVFDEMPTAAENEYLRFDREAKQEAKKLMEDGDPLRKDYINLGKSIKLNIELGLTQTAIASYLHVSEHYVNGAVAAAKLRKKDLKPASDFSRFDSATPSTSPVSEKPVEVITNG